MKICTEYRVVAGWAFHTPNCHMGLCGSFRGLELHAFSNGPGAIGRLRGQRRISENARTSFSTRPSEEEARKGYFTLLVNE